MDLNPDAQRLANPDVLVIHQDCSRTWNIADATLDTVFSSNFFEHLPDKAALDRTLREAYRGLKPGGHLVAIGPNVKLAPGQYWDFFDHYLPLTELSLAEVLRKCGFEVVVCLERFLPYTMSSGRQYPIWMLRAFLAIPVAWKVFGKQFLVVARKR
jgi:SAM-dependent methyltransferase